MRRIAKFLVVMAAMVATNGWAQELLGRNQLSVMMTEQ